VALLRAIWTSTAAENFDWMHHVLLIFHREPLNVSAMEFLPINKSKTGVRSLADQRSMSAELHREHCMNIASTTALCSAVVINLLVLGRHTWDVNLLCGTLELE
jgi:hypothetical protein